MTKEMASMYEKMLEEIALIKLRRKTKGQN